MKKYKIYLMTEKGPVMVEYCDSQPLAEFEDEILAKYGTFTTLYSQEIKWTDHSI